MRNAHEWFDEYGVSHQNPTNKLIHWVCVPLIFFSVIGLLSSIPHSWLDRFFPHSVQPYIHYGTLLILSGGIFYLTMSFTIFLGMMIISLLFLILNALLDQLGIAPVWLISLIIFILAWIGQFVGHKIEGAKPSFFKDLLFLLVGPAWLLGFVYKKFGIAY